MTCLNLGCGLDYQPDAINLDRYDLTVADLQTEALGLPFADHSVAQVQARQLIEHLGYAGALFALAEWWRVLMPGGTLLVETPDRTAACRAAAEQLAPAPVLHWLFGLPRPGYLHRTLFSKEDLIEIAQRAGLEQVTVTRIDSPQAILRLSASKPPAASPELRSRLHTAFVSTGLIDPLTAPPYMEHVEGICDRVMGAVRDLAEKGIEGCLASVLGATARFDPRATQAAIRVLVAQELIPAAPAGPYLGLANSLVKEQFPSRITALLRQSPSFPGTQPLRLQRLEDRVSIYLTARLFPQEAVLQAHCRHFDALTTIPITTDREISFFCAEAVTELGWKTTAQGMRAFAHKQFDAARGCFQLAAAYDADNPLPVWNLARLNLAEGRQLEALECYAALLELLPHSAPVLRSEMDFASGRQSGPANRFLGPALLEDLP